MKKYSKYLFVLIPLLLSIVTYKSWLTGKIFTYSDWPYYHIESLITNAQLSVWASWLDFGYFDNLTLWRKPIQILYGLGAHYGFGKEKSDILLAFIPIVIVNPIVSYFTFLKLSKSKVGALVSTFIFNFNTYFLAINTQGHLYLTISSSLVLLGIYIFVSHVNTSKIAMIILLSVLSLFIAILDLRNLYILYGLMFMYVIYIFVSSDLKIKSLSPLFSLLFIAALTALLNSFWLFVQLQSSSLLSNSITSRSVILGRFFSISEAISLSHPFWTGNGIEWFTINLVPFQFWFIPIMVFSTFLFNRNRLSIYFGIVAIIGIILSKQQSAPFINLYEFFFSTLPGFNAFREASKFYLLTIIGYSFLICFNIGILFKDRSQKKNIIIKYTSSLILILIMSWNTLPYITGGINALDKPINVPEGYEIFNDKIIKQNEYSRTLWIPADSKWGLYNNSHPKMSIINLIYGSWVNLTGISPTDVQNRSPEHMLTALIDKKYFNQLLNNSSIKYIAIPIEYNFNKLYTLGSREVFIDRLDKTAYLQKINIDTPLVIYKNTNARPHIYTTFQKETIFKEIEYKKTDFVFKNPTEYTIKITKSEKPFYLNFSEAYHPDWKLRAGEFNWFKVLTDKNYFINDMYHTESDAKLNSFYIDPGKICKSYECKKNSNGTYDISLTLFFRPQSYMYFGLIISGTTLFICLSYLLYVGIKSLRK